MSFVFVFFLLVSNDTFNDTLKTDDNYSHSPVFYWFWSSFSVWNTLLNGSIMFLFTSLNERNLKIRKLKTQTHAGT